MNPERDQICFLAATTRAPLAMARFPLGDMPRYAPPPRGLAWQWRKSPIARIFVCPPGVMMRWSVICARMPPNPVNSSMPMAACWTRGRASGRLGWVGGACALVFGRTRRDRTRLGACWCMMGAAYWAAVSCGHGFRLTLTGQRPNSPIRSLFALRQTSSRALLGAFSGSLGCPLGLKMLRNGGVAQLVRARHS